MNRTSKATAIGQAKDKPTGLTSECNLSDYDLGLKADQSAFRPLDDSTELAEV
jgi:hypothetical protein